MNETRLEKLLHQALSEQTSSSFDDILEAIRCRKEEETVPAFSTPRQRRKAVRRFVYACCAVVLVSVCCVTFVRGGVNYASASYPMATLQNTQATSDEVAVPESDKFTSRYGAVTGDGADFSSESVQSGMENGAILFNILPASSAAPAAKSSDSPSANRFTESLDMGSELFLSSKWLGSGLIRAISQQGNGALYDVVAYIPEGEQTEFSQQLQVNSLLTLTNTDYYLRLDTTQINRCIQNEIRLSLVGQGKPARPAYFPDNVDDKAAWISTHLQAGETTPISYEIRASLPDDIALREYAKQSIGKAYQQSGLAEPASVYYYTSEQQVVMSASSTLTCAQIIRLAGYDGENSTITSDVRGMGSNEAELDYYYLTNGDGWVFS